MIYLCNRVYAPFYKWMFHGLRFLPVLSEAVPLLEELALLPVQTNAWNTEKQWKDPEWLNREDQRQCLIENICQFVVDELNRQELTTSNASFLEHHTVHLLSRIQDEQLKHIPVMIG